MESSGTGPDGRGAIDRASPVPAYYQLFVIIRESIFSGVYGDSDTLPGEHELCRRYGISRATVRRALDELVSRGLIVRQPGQGTCVRRRPNFSPVIARVDGLLERTHIIGHTTEAEVLEFEDLSPPSEVAEKLGIDGGRLVRMSTIVRRLEGAPFVLFTSWVPLSVASCFDRGDLVRNSALSLLEKSGLIIDHIEQTIAAEPASRWASTHLQLDPGSPLLRIERVVLAKGGQAIEWSVARFPHDRHQYRLDLQAR